MAMRTVTSPVTLEFPNPTVTYGYAWPFGKGPEGIMLDRGRDADEAPTRIVRLQVVEFADGEVDVSAYGVPTTKTGDRDRRFSTAQLSWVDDAAMLAAHKEAKQRYGR